MWKRLIIGAVLIALAVGLLVLDGWLERIGWPSAPSPVGPVSLTGAPLAVVTMLLVAVGYLELARMAEGAGTSIPKFAGMVATMMVATWPFWRQMAGQSYFRPDGAAVDLRSILLLALLALTVMVSFAAQLARHRTTDAIRRIGAMLLAVCYLGVCGAVVLEVRMLFGIKAFALLLLVVKFTDIGAYFTGSLLGRHKIAPWLSPGKSWEGLAGGVALAVGAAMLYVFLWDRLLAQEFEIQISLAATAVFAAVVGVVGQAADMCESALKRDAGVKDAGRLLPGFGGILDVLDSPLLASPVALAMLMWIN
jgi:phosphatidate cytidylyltransferase